MWNYVTSLAATALALLEFAKDWREHKTTSRRTAVLCLIMLLGIGGAINTYYSVRDADKQHSEDQAQIARLQKVVETGNATLQRSVEAENATLQLILVRLAQPQVIQATPSGPHFVSLSWKPNETTRVVGYNIYRGLKSGGPYTKLNSVLLAAPSYQDESVMPGSTYYYVATAVSTTGAESPYSNEMQTRI